MDGLLLVSFYLFFLLYHSRATVPTDELHHPSFDISYFMKQQRTDIITEAFITY